MSTQPTYEFAIYDGAGQLAERGLPDSVTAHERALHYPGGQVWVWCSHHGLGRVFCLQCSLRPPPDWPLWLASS